VLGIFLTGMLTRSRGNDGGNVLAMIIGFIVVAILSGLPNKLAALFGRTAYKQPEWLPVMEFPWWIFFGTVVTFSVAILFRTSRANDPAPVVQR
jgi:solute:Na+ symporter, SSS family